MVDWRQIRVVAVTGLAAVGLYVGWVFLARHTPGLRWRDEPSRSGTAKEFERNYSGSEVRILQFYAREGSVTEGSNTVICYGVVNAKSVRITPAVAEVYPALNRCIEAVPDRKTEYTLTAEGNDGRTVKASFSLAVHPDLETVPQITSFQVGGQQKDYLGNPMWLLTFGTRNAELVEIEPPVFPTLHGAPYGQIYVKPKQTTTYTLTVTGKRGRKAQKQLTIELPKG